MRAKRAVQSRLDQKLGRQTYDALFQLFQLFLLEVSAVKDPEYPVSDGLDGCLSRPFVPECSVENKFSFLKRKREEKPSRE